MEISVHLHSYADKNVPHKQQAIIKSFAKALEIIPRQLCDNAGFDATDILNRLRVEHRKGNIWAGVDFDNEGVRDNMKAFVWEPALVKVNAIQAAVEACCLILSVDETIRNQESEAPQAPTRGLPPGAAQRALRGRGRGMPRRWGLPLHGYTLRRGQRGLCAIKLLHVADNKSPSSRICRNTPWKALFSTGSTSAGAFLPFAKAY